MDTPAVNNGWKLFGLILIINIAQSLFTPLVNDEAYYWLYSRYLSWGYFDHPPMVAFLIRMGSTLLPTEIGVRLFGAIIGSLTFWLVYKLIEGETDKPVNFKLAGLLLFSSLFLNMYSFLAIPDTPMLFFATLFLYTYRRYINNDNLLNTILLGLVTALLLYSKYHGILLVGFTVLSNIRLLLRRSFYIVFVVALVLFIPHINWQVANDYPTIRFQFFERTNPFNLQHVFSYLGEQAAVTGPVMLLLFSILYRPENQFQKTLKYNVIGVFLFFLFSSFKEMVNVHWTAIAWPAMLCLAYLFISQLKTKVKLVTGILVVNLVMVMVLRVNFIGNFFQLSNFNDKNPAAMTAAIKTAAGGHPVVFMNMYNEPSYYMFYGNQKSFAVNDIGYKRTQFNYLPQLENAFQRKTICLITENRVNTTSSPVSITKGQQYFATIMPGFASFNDIKISAENLTSVNASAQNIIRLTVSRTGGELTTPDSLHLLLNLTNNKTQQRFTYKYDKELNPANPAPFDFAFKAPGEQGTYSAVFSVVTKDSFFWGFNSNTFTCKVE